MQARAERLRGPRGYAIEMLKNIRVFCPSDLARWQELAYPSRLRPVLTDI